uniref:Uncharacterized protein n=1 Tax=Arundo donax TaxID=35708 RepID=A0A0A9EYK9_ARUDO
MRQPGQMLVR